MTTPTGPISIARDALRRMIADCAVFRAWIGASGDNENQQSQALNRIYVNVLPRPANGRQHTRDELLGYLPCALVYTGHPVYDSQPLASREYSAGGVLMAKFFWEVPEEIADNDFEIETRLHNFLGDLVEQLKGLAGVHPYLGEIELGISENFSRTKKEFREPEGDYLDIEIMVKWAGI